MIQLQAVSKLYNRHKAVDNISFTVQKGETLVLLGTSGCGKTTTLRMINRLTEATSGAIFFDDKNIMEHEPALLRRNMGYVLQHIGLFPHYTVAENISIVPKLLQWKKEAIENRVDELLEKLHLPVSTKNSFPTSLSGGQQQRVGLARALAANPEVLLMDEPLGALDPITRDSIRKDFLQLDELKKKTIVMVTHDIQEAFELADRICLMNKGKIEQIGTKKELLFKPASDFAERFFDQQRFQLEMQATTINDVIPFLKNNAADERLNIVEKTASVWQAMELITSSKKMEAKDEIHLTIENLAAAFSAFKKQVKHA